MAILATMASSHSRYHTASVSPRNSAIHGHRQHPCRHRNRRSSNARVHASMEEEYANDGESSPMWSQSRRVRAEHSSESEYDSADMAVLTTRQEEGVSEEDSGTNTTSRSASVEYLLDDVPHLRDWHDNLESLPHPSIKNPAHIVDEGDYVVATTVVNFHGCAPSSEECTELENMSAMSFKAGDSNTEQKSQKIVCFPRAGPRANIAFDSVRGEVRAAIVSCGGLCPGMNTVIRELVACLWNQYGVRDIFGVKNGFRGFYSENLVPLNMQPNAAGSVATMHREGGTFLGTSRGGFDVNKVVDAIEHRRLNTVFVIGGDGTHKGAQAMFEEVRRRKLKVAIACVPKTIDNDIAAIDKSFGFDTAVEEAQRSIRAAHVEAESAPMGVGLVKLMGRHSGFIAVHSSLASRDVDATLIPEVPFVVSGPNGVAAFVAQRLMQNDHALVVVAEGAGQDLMDVEHSGKSNDELGRDASGNIVFRDVGLWLKHELRKELNRIGLDVNMKYLDPTYSIRAIPPNASDSVYCTLLAHGAVHGAMYGFSGFTSGRVNERHCLLSIPRAIEHLGVVDPQKRTYSRLIESNNQPAFWGDDHERQAHGLGGGTSSDANNSLRHPLVMGNRTVTPHRHTTTSFSSAGRRVVSDRRADGTQHIHDSIAVTHSDEADEDEPAPISDADEHRRKKLLRKKKSKEDEIWAEGLNTTTLDSSGTIDSI